MYFFTVLVCDACERRPRHARSLRRAGRIVLARAASEYF
jgi:hypothetical protein